MSKPFLVDQWKWYAVSGWRIDRAVERTAEAALFGGTLGAFATMTAFALYFADWGHVVQGAILTVVSGGFLWRCIKGSRDNARQCGEHLLETRTATAQPEKDSTQCVMCTTIPIINRSRLSFTRR